MKIVLGLPTADAPSRRFIESLARLRLPAGVAMLERIVVHGDFVPGQREMIAAEALRAGADVLIMMDDDMVLPPETLELLVEDLREEPRLAAVGVLYYSRDGAQPMAVTRWASGDVAAAAVPAFSADGPTLVDGVGFGCVALRCAALAELELPLFGAQAVLERAARRVRLCNEDYLLCERLRGAGWRVALDGRLRAGHHDRASDRVLPERWESAEATAAERMLVRGADGAVRLAPYDATAPCVAEEYRVGAIHYVARG